MSAQGWQPNPEGVKNILQILQNTQNPDTEVQKQIHKALDNYKKLPEFNRYLMFILVHLKDEQEYVRTCAGIILKNNIYENYARIDANEQIYLKSEILKVLGDSATTVRRTCGSIITTLIGVGSIRGWPGIIQFLVSCLDHNDSNVVSGAFNALEKICEDHSGELDEESSGRPVNILLPKFLSLFNRPEPEMRYLAICCIIKFIESYPNQMAMNKERFIQGYFHLANDPEIPIRRRAVSAFLLMEELQMSDLKPYIPKVIEFILACMQQDNEDLALEATEFWKILTEYDKICDEIVKPLLPHIFPILLTRMIYSQQDLLDLGVEHENSHIPDKPQDIRPQFTTSVSRGHGPKEDDDVDNEYDYVSHWNIRKGSAEALDFMSRTFKGDTLPPLLPLFEQGFKSTNWLTRESCILGLGCISSGCIREMERYLPGLVPYLFNLLNDEYPLIRSISCWTLGRYSSWICKQDDKTTYFNRLVSELIHRMQDKNKRVQKAATSGIAAVIESANGDILPYTEAILNSFNLAFQSFQRQNLVVLYDAISTLAEVLGPDLNEEKYLRLLLPPLLHKWESLTDTETDLFPVLECLSFVSIALGPSFEPYAKPIFDRCIRLIENVIVGTAMHQQDPRIELPNREFLICSIDLLSGLCEALKNKVEQLVLNSRLVVLLNEICKDPAPDYCQSCYALVGDLAKYSIRALTPTLTELVPLLIRGMNIRFIESTNNAIWAIGEIIMKVPVDFIVTYSQQIFDRIIEVFNSPEGTNVMETCAVTIGRLGLLCPMVVAPHLNKFGRPICIALHNLPDDPEKEDALRGLCQVISKNPTGILNEFQAFCDVLTSFYNPNPPLKELFGNLLHAFKREIPPDQWQRMIDSFPNRVKNTLRNTYNI